MSSIFQKFFCDIEIRARACYYIRMKGFEEIIPTASAVLAPLACTDIAVGDMIDFLKFRGVKCDPAPDPAQTIIYEARYKLIDWAVKRRALTQVLELAGGFLLRGQEFCRNPKNIYAEIDLPKVTKLKREFVGKSPNWHMVGGNALDNYDFCDKFFDKNKPVGVVNSGLLRYLTLDEKTAVAKNVKKILQKYGGAWITCDLQTNEYAKREQKLSPVHVKEFTEITDRFNLPRFENDEALNGWIDDLGFCAEIYDLSRALDLGLLTAPEKLGLKNAREILSGVKFCEITIKQYSQRAKKIV